MTREQDYGFVATITTRWRDGDAYGHVNNVEYYAFFDTAINTWLVREGGLDPAASAVIGVCATSQCTFHRSLTFPDEVRCGVRVTRLGSTSATYALALFDDSSAEPAATGSFVHVFVDRAERRPAEIPERLRIALQRLVAAEPAA